MEPLTITASMTIERDGEEITVTITGTFSAGCRGRKAHPMDRFAEPDEPDEMADITATDAAGQEIELTDAETEKAEEALFEAVGDQHDRDMEAIGDRRREEEL